MTCISGRRMVQHPTSLLSDPFHYKSRRLIEQTEAHVLIRLILLLFLLLCLALRQLHPPVQQQPPAAGAAPPPPPPPPDGTDASLLVPSEINWVYSSDAIPPHMKSCRNHCLPHCMSFPLSSEINLSKRSLSASIPTEERTASMSEALGEVLPPRPRRRYAARCFIVIVL